MEELVSGVMEELRALRVDVEKLQKDKVESENAAETQATNNRNTFTQGTSTDHCEQAAQLPQPSMHSSVEQLSNAASSQATLLPSQGSTQYGAPQNTPSPGRHPTQSFVDMSSFPQAATDYASLGASHNPAMEAEPVPASALPEIDIVPIHIKKDIWRGKDINLAILLLPVKDRKYAAADRDMQVGGEVFTLKGKSDSRLTRDLTIAEFISAFTILHSQGSGHW